MPMPSLTPYPQPTFTPCKALVNAGGAGGPILQQHNRRGGGACFYSLEGAIFLMVNGSPEADPRPGYMVCRPPKESSIQLYCVDPPASGDPLAHWSFYPLPIADLKEVGRDAGPQEYQCLGDNSGLWTFHYDTLTFTRGCVVPPDWQGIGLRPCDAFMYAGVDTTPLLFLQYGRPIACALEGRTVVGVTRGQPQPGVVICRPPADPGTLEASTYCGFLAGPVPDRWQFVALPVASGSVMTATITTTVGAACVTVDSGAFTLDLTTLAISKGCSHSGQ